MNMRFVYIGIGTIYLFWLVYLFIHFRSLPETIPVHFNALGEVDGWGSRATIWFLPGIGLFTTLLVLFVPQYTKNMINYPVKITEENREKQYQLVLHFMIGLTFLILGLFIYINWITIQIALSGDAIVRSGIGVWIFVGLIFTWIAWYIARSHRLK